MVTIQVLSHYWLGIHLEFGNGSISLLSISKGLVPYAPEFCYMSSFSVSLSKRFCSIVVLPTWPFVNSETSLKGDGFRCHKFLVEVIFVEVIFSCAADSTLRCALRSKGLHA